MLILILLKVTFKSISAEREKFDENYTENYKDIIMIKKIDI